MSSINRVNQINPSKESTGINGINGIKNLNGSKSSTSINRFNRFNRLHRLNCLNRATSFTLDTRSRPRSRWAFSLVQARWPVARCQRNHTICPCYCCPVACTNASCRVPWKLSVLSRPALLTVELMTVSVRIS